MNGASQIKPNSTLKPDTKEDKNPYGIRRRSGKYYAKYTYKRLLDGVLYNEYPKQAR